MSNDKQEMPVEFIQEQLRKYVRYDNRSAVETFDKIFEQAKEMQKERMIEFAKKFIDVVNIEDKDVEIIYNKTYGGGKQ
jgi:hypothetical protein